MSSELPVSGTGAGDAVSSTKAAKSSSFSSFVNFIKKVYNFVKNIILIIKSIISNMSGSSSSSGDAAKTTKDILTQLANILPTGTFMVFQVIAPLATNSGHCGKTEHIITGTLLAVFSVIIAVTTFTDSVKIPSTGKVYYGLITAGKGLWNPAFIDSGIPGVNGAYYTLGANKYNLRIYDFINAAMSLAAFASLAILTDPVVKCFFTDLSPTVTKSVPLIVGAVVSFLLSFAPAARNGLGYRLEATETNSSTTTSALLHDVEPAGSTVAP